MSHKIVDYRILKADDMTDLEYKVNDLLHKGYVPHGNLVVHFRSGLDDRYWQPMVRWEAETPSAH